MLKQRVQRIETLRKRYAGGQRGSAPPPQPLRSAQDVIELLREQIEALRAAVWQGPVEKARAIGYLAEIARKTLETGKLASRLEILELVLKQRKGETPR